MKRKLTLIGAIILVLLTAAFLASKTRKTDINDYEVADSNTETSSEIIIFTPILPGNGVPYKTISKTGINNTSLYWVQESVVDGSDGCILYDNTSRHIYASRSRSSGQIGNVETSTTYYENGLVSKGKALSALDKYCFEE